MPTDSKDSKSKFSPRAPRLGGAGKPGMSPLVAGIIIGLLLGIFLALGVAMWLNRAATPFVEKNKPVEQLPPMKTTPADKSAAPGDVAKQRFEFYDILPGNKANEGTKDAAIKTAPKADTKVDSKPEAKAAPKEDAAPSKSPNETLYLQAGAFQSESDADAMKAKIAFAGFEASVKPVNVAGKGTLYRVRLGPYRSQDEVNRIKQVLSQNGIGAAVVKPD